MNDIHFTFSDTIAGYVSAYDRASDVYSVTTPGGTSFSIKLKSQTYAQLVRNLEEPYQDCTGQMRDMLVPGRFVFTYGVFYPEGGDNVFEAQFLLFLGRKIDEYGFEKQDWWVNQIDSLGRFYLKAQFGTGPVDYKNYRTTITLNG